jgi:hypothetical protein
MILDDLAILDDIALNVPDPAAYASLLRTVLRREFPHILAAAPGLGAACGPEPAEEPTLDRRTLNGTLGYNGDIIAELIDREWADSEENEFDALADYLTANSLTAGARSILVLPAGTCRLGDYLAAGEEGRSIVCADLSWLVLYFGRALIERRLDRLPEISRADRTFYSTTLSSAPRILETRRPVAFKPPFCARPPGIRYEVRDVFHASGALPGALVIVPFLLDCTSGAHAVTMLVRLLQQLTIGQELLLLMTCADTRKPRAVRDPRVVVETCEALGLGLRYLDLANLPYSFSRLGFGYHRVIWNTLVLKARKESEPVRDVMVTRADPGAGLVGVEEAAEGGCVVVLRDRRIALSAAERGVMERCSGAGIPYGELRELLRATVDPGRFDGIIGTLASKQLLELTVG